jgi:NAD(P)-dependent dehydrogenase (short-subunit alcohol dehydrogenase family)
VSAIEAEGRRALSIVADVRDEKQVNAMVEHVVAKLGRLDVRSRLLLKRAALCTFSICARQVMVANAGIYEVNGVTVFKCT